MNTAYLLIAASVFFVLSGCNGESHSQPIVIQKSETPIEWDLSEDDELLAYTKIQMKTYQQSGFTEVTHGRTESALPDTMIRVWVNQAQADNYQNLSSSSEFPVGTTIIRVIVNEWNTPQKITVAVKASLGRNPASNDWIFAVANAEGVMAVDDDNDWQFGALESCNTCHTNRLHTDGLFGLF